MKINKIEVNITFFILSLAIFLLNFNQFSLYSILIGSILAYLLIMLNEKTNITNFKYSKFVIIIISFLIEIIYLNKLTCFISSNILRNYSGIVISLLLLISSLLLIKKGYHTIIKVVLLSSYFFLIIITLGIILGLFYLKIENYNFTIVPDNLFNSSILYAFLIFYIYLLTFKLSNAKFNFKAFLISTCYHLFNYLFVIGILSNTLTNLYEFSFIVIYKKINLLNFIERIEFIFSLNYLFCFYYFFVFNFYYLTSNLKIKNEKNQLIITSLISISIFIISLLIT